MELERGAEPTLMHLLDNAKVVILEGGRGVGKTTLAGRVAITREFNTVFDLSDPADRSALNQDPHRVLAAAKGPILIDEAQLEPELTVAVKRLVDDEAEPGQVLLTGSARIGRGALGGGDPLAGRAVRLRLHPFTQAELGGKPNSVFDRWWDDDPKSSVYPELGLGTLHEVMTTGGLPAVALGVNNASAPPHDIRTRALSAYVEGVLTANLAGSRVDRSRLLRAFRYLAANPGQILNVNRAASDLSMRAETVQAYLDLCEASFLLDTAPALRPKAHQVVTAHPRLFVSDVGLAAWAADTSPAKLLRDPRLSGSLLENLVANELAAQAAWSMVPIQVVHWRDSRKKVEVDLVLTRPDGSMLAFEVKSSSSVDLGDAKGLIALAEAADGRLQRSFIVYTGRAVQQLAERVWAIPLSALMTADAAGS